MDEAGDDESEKQEEERSRDRRTGRYQKEYTDEEIIAVVEDLEIASTTEIAEELGAHHNQVRRRLKDLDAEGRVVSKEMGNTWVWLPSD